MGGVADSVSKFGNDVWNVEMKMSDAIFGGHEYVEPALKVAAGAGIVAATIIGAPVIVPLLGVGAVGAGATAAVSNLTTVGVIAGAQLALDGLSDAGTASAGGGSGGGGAGTGNGSPGDTADKNQANADATYQINIAAQDSRYQADDAGQLKDLIASMGSSALSLDQKLALVQTEIDKGLGTDSMKIAIAAKGLAQDYYDMNNANGARAIAKRNLDNQLLTAKETIAESRTNRDIGLSGIGATNAALGVSGGGATAQVASGAYEANTGIQKSLRQAGYKLDALGSWGGDGAAFDSALALSLTGDNTYLQEYEAEVTRQNNAFNNNLDLLGNELTGLVAMDKNYRDSSKNNREGAQINIDAARWQMDQQGKKNSNWLLGAATFAANVAGKVPTYGAAFKEVKSWYS